MKTFLTLILLISSCAYAGTSELSLEDMSDLIPSFLLDRSGFESDDLVLEEKSIEDAVPLMPLFQSGALGKKNYIGGVVESKFIQGLSPLAIQELKRKILSVKLPDGVYLQPYTYGGKLYGIRSDYQVVYSNSTTVGFGMSFGAGRTVALGNNLSIGLRLDLGNTINLGKVSGLNLGDGFQRIMNDWAVASGRDDSQLIIDQATKISPLLMSYLAKDAKPLLDESGRELTKFKTQNDDLVISKKKEPLQLSTVHTSEWDKMQKDLQKNLKKEIDYKNEIQSQVKAQKIVALEKQQKLIQSICDRLAVAYQVPEEIHPRCRIASTLVPNAWAFPGGDIFITAGLLGILSELDSVALVLGHEIGHVMARHSSKKTKSTKEMNYVTSYISTALNFGLSAFSLGGGFGVLGNVSLLTWYPKMLASQVSGGFALKKGSEIAVLAPMASLMLQSRKFESEADRLGQEAAFSAGADLQKMNQGWKEFVDFFTELKTPKMNLKERLLADHPDAESRLDKFEDRSEKLNNLLSQTNAANLWPAEDLESYRKTHLMFRPYIDSYVRGIQEKRMDKNKTTHFLQTLSGAHLQCMKHALGGY